MGHRVLVIDDSQTIRKLVELSFRALPFAVEYATSGTDGITRARANPPDVVLLDVVLPDMKGLDVCRALARDDRTSQCLVVLMTAKDAAIREQFNTFTQVVGFLHKPFTAHDLLTSLDVARQQLKTRPAPKRTQRFNFEQKEALAKELYSRLKTTFGLIPEWSREMGDAQPASFFARKILTPELIEDLITPMADHLETALRGAPAAASADFDPSAALSGRMISFSLLDLLRGISGSQRTGMLVVTARGRRTWLYFRRGSLVMVTNDSPSDYVRSSGVDLSGVAADARERAEADQVKTGKPVFVSLAESGQLPSGSLSRVLYTQGKQALLEVLEASQIQFAFNDLPSLPLFVEAQGREISFGQIQLEQLRRTAATLMDEKGADALQWIFERAPGFSRRLRSFALTADERRVLTLIDGRYSVAKVIRRSGIAPSLVSAVVHRLCEVELIRRSEPKPTGSRRAVLIDPDVEGVQKPLERLLHRRREPIELVSVNPDDPDLLTAIVRERPQLLLVDASALGEKALDLGRRVFESPALSHLSSAALLETRDPRAHEALVSAGFDAVLFKPVWFGDIERLLNE